MMVHVGIDIIGSRMPVIKSQRLVKEMRMFMELTKKSTGSVPLVSGDEMYKRVKVGAPPGEHDDLVMAWLQAQTVCDLEVGSANRKNPKEKELPPPNWTVWGESDDYRPTKKSGLGSKWV